MHACSASAQAGASGRYCRGRHRCVPGYVRALGADRVIDTKSQHLAELSIGADIVIDTVGGQDQDQVRAAKARGIIVSSVVRPNVQLASNTPCNPIISLLT